MFPDKCSVSENDKQCVNPPEFVISVILGKEEYMVGVTCNRHRQAVYGKIEILQKEAKIPKGKINFLPLKPVGTDCIKGNPDDLIQL